MRVARGLALRGAATRCSDGPQQLAQASFKGVSFPKEPCSGSETPAPVVALAEGNGQIDGPLDVRRVELRESSAAHRRCRARPHQHPPALVDQLVHGRKIGGDHQGAAAHALHDGVTEAFGIRTADVHAATLHVSAELSVRAPVLDQGEVVRSVGCDGRNARQDRQMWPFGMMVPRIDDLRGAFLPPAARDV